MTYTTIGLTTLQGRKHFEEQFGKPQGDRKPCIKKVNKAPKPPDRVQSVKYIKPVISQGKLRPEKGHVHQIVPKNEKPEFPIHTRTVRTASDIRVRDLPTVEYDFHQTQLGRKKPVLDPRNGLPVTYKGDKAYGTPEYASGYFREDGLFPRTVYQPRLPVHTKASTGNYNTILSYQATNPMRKRWSQRVREEAEADTKTALSSLLEWYLAHRERTILKEKFPNLKDADDTDEEDAVYRA